MRWIMLSLSIAVAGCSAAEISEEYYGPPRVMEKSRNAIKIWAGWKVDPMPVAVEHCGKVGLTPQLEKSQDYGSGHETVYWYKCV